MDDQELERRLGELKQTWRVTPEPPLDEIWRAVEARAFPKYLLAGRQHWTRTLLPLAAMLLLGFGVGQLAPSIVGQHRAAPAETAKALELPTPEPATAKSAGGEAPFIGIAADYLERVTALLVTLADVNHPGPSFEHSTAQARDLLATTRLLMDSPQARDPRLRALLDDLELVLAQVARLPRRAAAPDVYLIDETLDQREVLPRLRGLLAENSTSQP